MSAIRIFGIGSDGCRAVNYIARNKMEATEFIAIDGKNPQQAEQAALSFDAQNTSIILNIGSTDSGAYLEFEPISPKRHGKTEY